ncbi:MAG: aldolase [Paenibacillaceae bacterium]|nr:aldolase [Paenibacillaceae bacterium]
MNRIRTMLRQGEVPIGCFVGIYSPAIVEMAGWAGFDYVVIDNEHGAFGWDQVEEMIRAAELTGLVPIVRVPDGGATSVLKALDRGAAGIHVPQINTREEAEAVVAAAKFPPLGRRGAAYSVRSARYGIDQGSGYLHRSNDDGFVAVHIETPEAVRNIDGILDAGVDLAFIGPTDLSVSAGYPDDPQHPALLKMMDEVLAACTRKGVPVGIMAGDADAMRRRKAWGARYISVTFTALVGQAFRTFVRQR